MLQIRKEHFEAFEVKQIESFVNRMISHLREHFPEETASISEDRLCQFVEDELATANRFEIYNEDDIAVCIGAIFAIRPDPDTDTEPTWVKEVQSDPDLTSEQKAERLQQWAQEELEEQSKHE
jgi:hypothetical protein